jgi:hypothetical protein
LRTKGRSLPFVIAPALRCRATGGWSLPSLCHGVRICLPLSSTSFFAKWSFSSCVMLLLSSEAGLALEFSYSSNLGASARNRNAIVKFRSCNGLDSAPLCSASPAVLRGSRAVWSVYGLVEMRVSEARPAMRCFIVSKRSEMPAIRISRIVG